MRAIPNETDLLVAHVQRVRSRIESLASREEPSRGASARHVELVSEEVPLPSAFAALVDAFSLDEFERDVLFVAIGVELDPMLGTLCGRLAGIAVPAPTPWLMMRVLQSPRWSALSPGATLRRWRLLDVDTRASVGSAPVRIDERVLHHVLGEAYLDDRLAPWARPLPPPVHDAAAAGVAEIVVRATQGLDPSEWPIFHLVARTETGRAAAGLASSALGARLHEIVASELPAAASERDAIARLWAREAMLVRGALWIARGRDTEGRAEELAERTEGLVFVGGEASFHVASRSVVRVPLPPATLESRVRHWELALREVPLDREQLSSMCAQFPLSPPEIHAMAASVRARTPSSSIDVPTLWQECRHRARQEVAAFAEPSQPSASWDDLVLPPAEIEQLRDLAAQTRVRNKVYETWGFGARFSRGLGITALFAGSTGTGKTLAAEVLASELALDLHRIDLAQVVSKYIGETEKNLDRVFVAAEQSGAVLLFDEADALFGRRSDVKDSRDRYANIEVSYLLQRMESYRGLAILTTNLRDSLDPAFLRRLRFVVTFPFPDDALRARIWRRAFPPAVPLGAIDYDRLARLAVSGASIRNIALNATFAAAQSSGPVTMSLLRDAARRELGKVDRPQPITEVMTWA